MMVQEQSHKRWRIAFFFRDLEIFQPLRLPAVFKPQGLVNEVKYCKCILKLSFATEAQGNKRAALQPLTAII